MRQGDLIVNPTLACGNPLNFKEDLDILEKTGIKILHIDIMDGHYVPNLCFDTGMVRLIRKKMCIRDSSKGHAAPALYAVLAEHGFFSKESFKRLRKLGGVLPGHPDLNKTRCV